MTAGGWRASSSGAVVSGSPVGSGAAQNRSASARIHGRWWWGPGGIAPLSGSFDASGHSAPPPTDVETEGLFLHPPTEEEELHAITCACDEDDLLEGSLPLYDPANYPSDIPVAVVERLEYKESAAYLEHYCRHQHGVLVCAS